MGLDEFHLGERPRRRHRLLWTACVRFICPVASFAGITCTFPARWLVVYVRCANPEAGFGSLASRLQDASTTICRATADRCDSSTGQLQRLVRAARARPGLVDKGVSHVVVTQRARAQTVE